MLQTISSKDELTGIQLPDLSLTSRPGSFAHDFLDERLKAIKLY